MPEMMRSVAENNENSREERKEKVNENEKVKEREQI